MPFGSSRLYGGPRWGWTRRSIEHDGRAWHRIELPAEFAGDLDVFDLHPALLDAAVVLGARRVGADDPYSRTTRFAYMRRSSATSS
jgi:hypothetical protein